MFTDFGTGRVSGDDFGDSAGTSTFTGSFEGDGSSLTGATSTLDISGSSYNGTVAKNTRFNNNWYVQMKLKLQYQVKQ